MIPFMILLLPAYLCIYHPLPPFSLPPTPLSPSPLFSLFSFRRLRSDFRYMRPTELMDEWEMPMLMTREPDGRETPGRVPDLTTNADEWKSFTRVTIWGLKPSTIELFSSKDELEKLRQEVRC